MRNCLFVFSFSKRVHIVGFEFWKTLCAEHGISPEGFAEEPAGLHSLDVKDCFFQEYENNRYIPRCLLFDLEPRVISGIRNSSYSKLFPQENTFICYEGGGAGNNWAKGYTQAIKYKETFLTLMNKEVEAMDCIEGVLLTHAISGGTGSGTGSYILELLADEYPKTVIQTYSLFPLSQNMPNKTWSGTNLDAMSMHTQDISLVDKGESPFSDVVVEPYNSLLTLKRLTNYAQSVVILDNLALQTTAKSSVFKPQPAFSNVNMIVANIMSSSTAPLRFPGRIFNTLSEILVCLMPVHQLHFLTSGYTPLISFNSSRSTNEMKTTVCSVLERLKRMRNLSVSLPYDKEQKHSYISAFNIVQSKETFISMNQINRTISDFGGKLRFVPWARRLYNIAFCRRSPYLKKTNNFSGLVLANHTNIQTCFEQILSQFSKLYSRHAYIDQMQKFSSFDDLITEIEDCQQCVEDLLLEYRAAMRIEYRPYHDDKLVIPTTQS